MGSARVGSALHRHARGVGAGVPRRVVDELGVRGREAELARVLRAHEDRRTISARGEVFGLDPRAIGVRLLARDPRCLRDAEALLGRGREPVVDELEARGDRDLDREVRERLLGVEVHVERK